MSIDREVSDLKHGKHYLIGAFVTIGVIMALKWAAGKSTSARARNLAAMI